MLTVRESSEAWESGPGSIQSAGMQESVGECRRVQVSTGNCENQDFIGQGESRRINAQLIFKWPRSHLAGDWCQCRPLAWFRVREQRSDG